MWEAIAANRRRSFALIVLMAVILIGLGYAIGAAVSPTVGGPIGAAVAFVIWTVMWLSAIVGGDQILLRSAGAHEIQKHDAPRLWNVVEEMCLASGLRTMPKVYIIESDAPNAFAVGRKPEKAAVAVTSGLLRRLSRDELQGVIAHEIGHIQNLDIRFMLFAGVMVGSITLLADVFVRGVFYSSLAGRRSSSGRGNAQVQIVMFILALVLAILAPILARALYYACSRQREYLADASAARYTRYPLGLASALEKIALRTGKSKKKRKEEKANRVLAPMYIINPGQAMAATGPFATHPPTMKRIEILRSMGGAGYANYQSAYESVQGSGKRCLGERTLSEAESVDIREPLSAADEKKESLDSAREVLDLLDRIGGFLLIPCVCGLRIKLPPEFKQDSIKCTRCGRDHEVPGTVTGGPGVETGKGTKEAEATYRRKTDQWESFRCSCGQNLQLSPNFSGEWMRCSKCSKKIMIQS